MTWAEWRGAAAPELRKAVIRVGGRLSHRAGNSGRKAYRSSAPVLTGHLRQSVFRRVRRRRTGDGEWVWDLRVGLPADFPYRHVLAHYPGVSGWVSAAESSWSRRAGDVLAEYDREMRLK